jgi:drug/metabolite transporter (DMT)-like permease
VAVLLALGAALAYGLSDFIGGVASRRTSAWPVAFTGASTGMLVALLLALALPGDPSRHDLAWGAVAGIGNGVGGAFLYRGLALGRMGVVGPVSAVGAAALPVVVGVLTGERPAALVWMGIVVALPAIWLVAREPGSESTRTATGLVDGVLAGIGFGLLFAAMGQVEEGAGFLPVVASQLIGLLAIVVLTLAMGGRWLPRHRTELLGGAGAGALASVAVVGFLIATQKGLLAVSAVLASLYPATTVLLASLVLREPVHRVQAVGLVLCAVSVVCVVVG